MLRAALLINFAISLRSYHMKTQITRLAGGILTLLFLLGVLPPAFAAHKHGGEDVLPTEELKRLNRTLKASDLYMRDKTARLDSLTKSYQNLSPAAYDARWQGAMRLSELYLPLRADSSLRYSQAALAIARETGDNIKELSSKIACVNSLGTCGIFTKALEEFNSMDEAQVPEALRIQYWSAGRKLYGYMRLYVEGEQMFFKEYSARYFQFDDSLVKYMPANDKMRQFYVAERMVNQGRYPEAKSILDNICKDLKEDANLYGMAMFQLGIVAKNEGDQKMYATFLIKAAISDIKGCVKDGLAMPTLAEWLYKEGELNLAFQYINSALEDAMEGNVRMRTITIAALLPVIDEAYREKINASRDELMVYFLLVTFLLILSGGLVVVLMRTNRRSRDNARKLAKTSQLQESYIGHFIGLCSTYANRLQSLQKLVVRKLASGQADELQKLIKSGKFGEDQNEEFYKIFDSAFLDIYPDFIEKMNLLLRPEEAIELKKDGELSPELRIYAFVRLGVEESTRIAQMLNYSVSTVYAYRNRMRNRAIDRENFDRDVMQIGRSKEVEQ